MAKGDFICKLCGDVVKTQKLFGFPDRKYVCPKCGEICKKHIKTRLFGAPTCTNCGSKVLQYEIQKGRWTQV